MIHQKGSLPRAPPAASNLSHRPACTPEGTISQVHDCEFRHAPTSSAISFVSPQSGRLAAEVARRWARAGKRPELMDRDEGPHQKSYAVDEL